MNKGMRKVSDKALLKIHESGPSVFFGGGVASGFLMALGLIKPDLFTIQVIFVMAVILLLVFASYVLHRLLVWPEIKRRFSLPS